MAVLFTSELYTDVGRNKPFNISFLKCRGYSWKISFVDFKLEIEFLG